MVNPITSRNFVMVDKNLIRFFKGDFNLLGQLYLYIELYNLYYSSNKLQDDGTFFISNDKTSEKLGVSCSTISRNKKKLCEMGFISVVIKEVYGVSFIKLNLDKIYDIQQQDYDLSNVDEYTLKEGVVYDEENQIITKKETKIIETNETLPAIPTSNYGKKIMVSWNAIAEKYGLAKINQCKEDRIKRFKNILKLVEKNEHELFLGIDEAIKNSNFLKGKTGWKCSFDFFMQKSSIQKALEGQYNDSDTPIVNTTKADIKQKEFEQMANSFLSNDKDVIIY